MARRSDVEFLLRRRQRRRIGLEAADRRRHSRAPSARNRAAISSSCARHDVESGQQRRRTFARAQHQPCERALRHARIDQRQLHAACRAPQDQVRPEIGIRRTAPRPASNDRESARSPRACPAARIDGSRLAAGARPSVCAMVTVPLVTSTLAARLVSSVSIRGSAARLSPTLAPCTQISWPAGRGDAGMTQPLAQTRDIFLAARGALAQQQRRKRRSARSWRSDRRRDRTAAAPSRC